MALLTDASLSDSAPPPSGLPLVRLSWRRGGKGWQLVRQAPATAEEGVALAVSQADYGRRRKLAIAYALQADHAVIVVANDLAGSPPPWEAVDAILRNECRGAIAGGGNLALLRGGRLGQSLRWLAGAVRRGPFAWMALEAGGLRQLPWELNSPNHGFDTELAIQCAQVPDGLVSLPWTAGRGTGLPLRRRLAAIRPLWRFLFHRSGLLYQIQYDQCRQEPEYTAKLGYLSSHTYALRAVGTGAKVMDIGCGQHCYLAPGLRAQGCRVWAVDARLPSHPDIEAGYQVDLDTEPLPASIQEMDAILLLDIVEHLRDPEGFLLMIRRVVRARGVRVVLSVPNVGFIVVRLMLLIGQFNHGKSGILDRTHTRLFTVGSLRRLLRQCGYEIEDFRGIPAPYPKAIGDHALARFAVWLNGLAARAWPSLFGYQLCVTLRTEPSLEGLGHDRDAVTAAGRDPA